MLFKLPLRQTAGMVASLLRLAGLDWPVPDYSTLCRRQKTLKVQIPYRRVDGPLNLLVDIEPVSATGSSEPARGIKFLGDGEWQARKHGVQGRRQWRKVHLAMDTATSDIRAVEFGRHVIDDNLEHGHFPDYIPSLEGEFVVFRGRGSVPQPIEEIYEGRIDPEIYHEAREVAPGWDVRFLEHEWRKWCAAEEIEPKRPDRHYIKFCQSWFEKRGRP